MAHQRSRAGDREVVVPSWSHTLQARPEASFEARRLVIEATAERFPSHVQDDAVLLTSELVANAFRHGTPARGTDRGITLNVTAEASKLRISVLDPGPGFDPRRATQSIAGGWGLSLVDRLASRWGVQRERGRTEVWFEMDAAGAG